MENFHHKTITQDVQNSLYREATEYLLNYRIATGLAQARVLQHHCTDQSLSLQFEAVCTDYSSMLSFIKNGGTDPELNYMQQQIVMRSLDILDAIHRNVRIRYPNDDYARTEPTTHSVTFSPEESDLLQQWGINEMDREGYALQDKIFDRLWTMEALSPAQTASIHDFIQRQQPLVQRYFVGGLLMALWEYFDKRKIRLLTLFMNAEDMGVRALATTGYVLAQIRYAGRLALYADDAPSVHTERFREEISIVQHFLFMQKNCIQIYEHLAKEIKKNMQSDAPEEEKQEIMNRVMCDRADLNPRTFLIAYNRPFFHRVSSWWMPYDQQRPEIREALDKSEDKSLLKLHDFLLQHCCDVDMHAIVQMLGTKGLGVKTSMFANPTEEIDHEQAMPEETTPQIVYSLIIQNLYRFFSYSKWNKVLPNPFEMNIYLPSVRSLAPYFSSESLEQLHAMLMRTQTHNAALLCAQDIIAKRGSDAQILLDCGQCHLALNNPSAALQCYQQADFLLEDDITLLKEMAKCYTKLKYYPEALDCLTRIAAQAESKLEDHLPESANCHLQLKAYDKALQCFFEMKYHNLNPLTASRGIIWCTFQLKQYEKARAHSAQLFQQNRNLTQRDHIVAGHIEWAAGNWQEALTHYQSSIKLYIANHLGNKIEKAWDFIEDDRHMLRTHGITTEDMMLMSDIISSLYT